MEKKSMRKEIRSTSDMMNLNAVTRKNGTETEAAAQKQKGNEAAQAKAHAEGCAEGKAAASDAHAEAVVAAQEQKEAETAKKKTQVEGWTNISDQIRKEKDTHPQNEKWKRRNGDISEWNCQRLRRVPQQVARRRES